MPISVEELPEIKTVEEGRAVIRYIVGRFSTLEAELQGEIKRLKEEISSLKKNSSNSSKPPSSDIVKPKPKTSSKKKRKRGAQAGRVGKHRKPFTREQVDKVEVIPATTGRCDRRSIARLTTAESNRVYERLHRDVLLGHAAVLCRCF